MFNTKLLLGASALGILALASTAHVSHAMGHTDKSHKMMDHSDKMMSESALSLDYSDASFMAAQAAGKHIVIDVWKKGCPTCKAQHPTLEKAKMTYPNAVFFNIDFSNQKNAVSKFNVSKQSTIIVFDGSKETGRVLGETNKDKLMNLIATGA